MNGWKGVQHVKGKLTDGVRVVPCRGVAGAAQRLGNALVVGRMPQQRAFGKDPKQVRVTLGDCMGGICIR